MQAKLVVGLGTGRCGTTSLAELLDAQPGWEATHEEGPQLTWKLDEAALGARLSRWELSTGAGRSDVASYYLPYVELILDRIPSARFVCLQRGREQTVHSFRRFAGTRNFWQAHDGTVWELEPRWDRCFPDISADTIEEAIGRYWDEYYAEVARLERAHPTNVRTWAMEDALNTEDGMRDVLDFVGVERPDQVVAPGIRRNRYYGLHVLTVAARRRTRHALRRLR